jgi:hypothetical protein
LLVGNAYGYYLSAVSSWEAGNYLASDGCTELVKNNPTLGLVFPQLGSALARQIAYDGLNTNISWYDAGMLTSWGLNSSSYESQKLVKVFKGTPVCGHFTDYIGVGGRQLATGKVAAASQLYSM